MKLRKYLKEGCEKLREKSKKLKKNKFAVIDIQTIVAVVISILVALVLLPIVIDAVSTAQTAINDSASTSHTMVGLVPLFYILGVLLSAVVYAVIQAKKV